MSKPSFPITGLWFRNTAPNDTLEVLVEHEGQWKVAFRYQLDAVQHGLVSHIIETAGLERLPRSFPDNNPVVARTSTPRKRVVLPATAKVGKRGYDYACEQCGGWEGSRLENGFYRCNGCGYPGQ